MLRPGSRGRRGTLARGSLSGFFKSPPRSTGGVVPTRDGSCSTRHHPLVIVQCLTREAMKRRVYPGKSAEITLTTSLLAHAQCVAS